MDSSLSYGTYLDCLVKIVEQLENEAASQGSIAQSERNQISEIENKFMQLSEELQQAKRIVQAQYANVWESCTKNAGLKKPRDQRPSPTNLSWSEAVHIQEQAATRVRDWFTLKSQQAFLERCKKVREAEAKRAALAAVQAEEARKRAEEAARAEAERGKALLESMKQKYRGNG